MLERLTGAEDADALFLLASWTMRGAPLRRDLGLSRELFRRAAAAGRRDAAVIVTALLAQGTGGPRDWPRAVSLLAGLGESDPRSRAQLELIRAMELTADGVRVAVPEGKMLSASPHVTHFPGLFTPAECAYLIGAAEPMLAPSVVVDNRTGRQVPDPVRTSETAGFTWPLENPAVHALNRRLAAASGTAVEQGEPLQVLRYRRGQEYKPHLDAIPGFANQRLMTVLVYLNDNFEGGETRFPSADLTIRGRAGDAILFRNLGRDGRPDRTSLHAGLPVTSGTKLIASRWIRQHPFEPPVG